MTDERHAIGANAPPLADQIELAYSAAQLAQDHEELGLEVQDMTAKAGGFLTVNDPATSEDAGRLVIELRALAKKVDDTHDAIKEPVLKACRSVDGFFSGLNDSGKLRPGPLTRHKTRIEGLIGAHAFAVAAEERRIAQEAAARERERVRQEQEAAAAQEAAGRTAVAEVVLEQAVKSEKLAEVMDARADGRVQDLARQRTPGGVIGLRGVPGYEITDKDALKATLGVLRDSFTADAIDAAIRKFRANQPEMAFEQDDVNSQERNVVSAPPLPGVRFFIAYQGSVRA